MLVERAEGSQFHGTICNNARVILGTGSHIADNVKIVGDGTVRFGDYCKVHSGTFINVPYSHSTINFGHNCWFGERCVLDGTGNIQGGNNIGAGIGSQLYSHIAHGDTGAGCRLYGQGKLLLEDDVWFVGQCFVSPIHARRRAVAALGSVITRDMSENRIYGGSPAKDITDKMGGPPWREITPKEQLTGFLGNVEEYATVSNYTTRDVCEFIHGVLEYPVTMDERVSYFNVIERTYTKRGTPKEIRFMKWLTSYKGRFTPIAV